MNAIGGWTTIYSGEKCPQTRLYLRASSYFSKPTIITLATMIFSRTTALFALASGVYAQSQYTSTGTAAVAKAAATALTLSPTSSVAGLTFDRFVQIWLENENYSAAIKDSGWPMPRNSNIVHVANLKFSQLCLSRVFRHHTH